ncbi:MAG: undecaprenyldiphospho-muramoylpentapeptide beta-N-acetylglucosaminyltransferase [Gammaproteobacteria bacterium]
MKKLKKVLMVAGGTGGHVFPGLAVAQELRAQGVEVEWLGTPTGIEAQRIPEAGIQITFIKLKGVRGMGWRRFLRAPLDICNAILTSMRVLRRLKPDVVCGMGGFAAGPAGVACYLARVPLVIHEQNAIAGFTNRVLARWAKRILVGLPQAQHKHALRSGCLIGNPLRAEFFQVPVPAERFTARVGALRILVLGGSQGAVAINKLIPQALQMLDKKQLIGQNFEVWHQVGPKNLAAAQEIYQQHAVSAKVVPFIEDVAAAYAWADVVICRSGALTVSELAAVGVPALLIPFPAAIDDHQTYNARYLADKGAAELLPQASLTAEYLANRIQELGADRNRLLVMAEAGRAASYPHATEYCIKELENVCAPGQMHLNYRHRHSR